MQNFMNKDKLRKMVLIAMLSAMAFLLTVTVRFSIVPAVGFLRYDPKDIVITIGGFLLGPLAAAVITVVVSLMQFLTGISQTAFWGLLMNIITGCTFACTAAFFYKRNRTMRGAVIGLLTAFVLTTVVAMLWNYLVVPIYMGIPRERVASVLFTGFLPFNLIKNGLNAAFTMMLYKYVKTALQKTRLMPTAESGGMAERRSFRGSVGVIILSLFAIGYAVLWIFVLQGWV